jgi:hypothetical protein
MEHSHEQHKKHENRNAYGKLFIMSLLSYAAMYFLMYAMVDSTSNVIHNVNQAYMAALMVGPMIIIELIIMRRMYGNKRLNVIVLATGTLILILAFFAIRKQTGVGDEQFLKSMIPHHAAAILMVNETELNDPELQKLAAEIISAQQKEIDFMKAKLTAIGR